MRKATRLFSILLAIVLVFTTAGSVFASEAPPPPIDDQTLAAPELNFPTGIPLYITNGIHFNWDDVPGADKYVFELEYAKDLISEWNPVIKPMTLSSKVAPLVPPTTVTVTTKKPLPIGVYHWRVTSFNTDVGTDPAGTGQSSDWAIFYIAYLSAPWSIGDTWPQVSPPTPEAYSGNMDPKKGEGSNDDTPNLNWVLVNGNNGSLITVYTMTLFKVNLSQGKNKWSQIVDAPTACTTITGDNRICTAPFSGFSGISALTPGVPYTWDVTGLNQGDLHLFPNPSVTMASARDTLEYNPESAKFPPPANAIVTDTVYTNKPTFGWDQPAGGLPDKGVYQIVVEKDDTKTSAVVWKPSFTATIIPNTTKIPGSTQVACPSGGSCFWRFAGVFDSRYYYRWNVRILVAGKYGPWAQSRTDSHALITGDAVNTFLAPNRPTAAFISSPINNSVDTNPYPDLTWRKSNFTLNNPSGFSRVLYYQVDLKRVSPAPLTRAISTEILSNETGDENETPLTDILPGEYNPHGLPRGVYQLVVSPHMKSPAGGQAGVYPASKSKPQKFIIGPAFPTGLAGVYDKTAKKMSVTFNKNSAAPAENVKYRILVKMRIGNLWRWVKIGTYTGASCPADGSPTCTLQIPAYKPGTTQALESGTYRIQIQQALKEEGNIPAKNKLWGPFGPLSDDATVGPF